MNKDTKSNRNVLSIIFRISLLIYPITIIYALFMGNVVGIDSDWAMPAWSDGELMYGLDAVWSYLIITVMTFWFVYLAVILFQCSYVIYILISKRKKKN